MSNTTYREVLAVILGKGRSYWSKVGAVFPVKDGMERLRLDFVPTSQDTDLLICSPRPSTSPGSSDNAPDAKTASPPTLRDAE